MGNGEFAAYGFPATVPAEAAQPPTQGHRARSSTVRESTKLVVVATTPLREKL